MSTEQITIKAVVRTRDGDTAQVEVEHGGCGRCHEEGGCGGQQLTQMFCGGAKTYLVDNTVGAEVGERVSIAVAAGSVKRSANLAYVSPLISVIGGAALGSTFGGNLGAVLGAGIGLILAFAYVVMRSRHTTGNITERPHIISRS